MRKISKDWLRVTSTGTQQIKQQDPMQLIRMLGMPGFQRVEDLFLLYLPRGKDLPSLLEDVVNAVSLETFGIRAVDIEFKFPNKFWGLPDTSEERWEIEDRWQDHEEQFDSDHKGPDHAVEVLLSLGFDFRDNRGHPMRSVLHFARQAEAAVKGIAGRIPDRATIQSEAWGDAIAREAERFLATKRR